MICSYCTVLQEKYPALQLRECRHDVRALDSHTPLHVSKKGSVPARIFVHPRCLAGPASGALTAVLQEHGYDINKMSVGPGSKQGHHELVRLHTTDPDGTLNLERMDGVKFTYKPLGPFLPSVA